MDIIESYSIEQLIKYLQDKNIFFSEGPLCHNCLVTMVLKRKENAIDKYAWKCTKCTTTSSIRNNTFLSSYRFPLRTFMKLLFHWSIQTLQSDQAQILDLTRGTIVSFQQRIRLIATKEFSKDTIVLGGNGKVIEIDESLFIKVKHHKGKDLKRIQIWVFGLYERDTKKVIFQVVPKRDAFTLLNIIYKHVAAKSIIYSDCWSSYVKIRQLDKRFSHLTVNHDLHFVDPSTGVHTNGIESNWCAAKTYLKKMRGVSRQYLSSYLDEFSWRRCNTDGNRLSAFEAIINAISKQYPPGTDSVEEAVSEFDKMKLNGDAYDAFDIDDGDDVENVNNLVNLPDYLESEIEKETQEKETQEQVVQEILQKDSEIIEHKNEVVKEIIEKEKELEKEIIEEEKEQEKELYCMNNEEFELFVTNVVKHVIDTKSSYKFPSSLSTEQRRIIHELSDKNNCFHKTTGTRYKCITISAVDFVHSPVRNRQKQAALLNQLSTTPISTFSNVSNVLNDNSKNRVKSKKKLDLDEPKKTYSLRNHKSK